MEGQDNSRKTESYSRTGDRGRKERRKKRGPRPTLHGVYPCCAEHPRSTVCDSVRQ